MNVNITQKVRSLLATHQLDTERVRTLELVIDDFDQWTNRHDAALAPTMCGTHRPPASVVA